MNAEKTPSRWVAKTLRLLLYAAFAGSLLAAGTGVAVWFYLEPRLPSIDMLKDVRLQVPLRVYTHDQRLIAEFGEKKRIPVRFGTWIWGCPERGESSRSWLAGWPVSWTRMPMPPLSARE